MNCKKQNCRFIAAVLIQAEITSHNPVAFIKLQGTNKKRLYKIYTPDELTQLADNFYVTFISGFDEGYLGTDEIKKQRSFLGRHPFNLRYLRAKKT